MEDEDTGAEPNNVSASIADPYLLLIRDDASIYVAVCDASLDLEEVERVDDILLSTKWLTGCLYADTTGAFASVQSDKGQKAGDSIMMFLLSAGGALYVSLSSTIPGSHANQVRFTRYRTYQRQFMWQKDCASCLLFYQLIMLQEDLPRERP